MRVKLFNCSKWPDAEVRKLLEHAAKEAGVDDGKGPIFTRINRGGSHSHGIEHRWTWVTRQWCNTTGKRLRAANLAVTTNGGVCVEIWPCITMEPLAAVEDFYKIAVHEFVHVADVQQHKPFGQYKKQWANRPHERRAITAATFGMLKRDRERDERILNLAIAIEEQK